MVIEFHRSRDAPDMIQMWTWISGVKYLTAIIHADMLEDDLVPPRSDTVFSVTAEIKRIT